MSDQIERKSFNFPGTENTSDMRIATALEFIAHYLDRIEGHLECTAARGETNPVGETIHHEMCDLRDLLNQKLADPS